MKLDELKRRVINERLNTETTRIFIDDKAEFPNATGCYKDGKGCWNIYSVSNRGTVTVTETGEENEVLDHFYEIAVALNDAYKKYGDMWS